MDLLVSGVQEEASARRGDFYCLILYCESGNDALALAFQRAVGGAYGHPRAGTPAYCLVIADHRSHYGGVRTITWTDAGFDIDLTDEACAGLKLADHRVILRLDLPVECVALVKEGLGRVFDPEPGNLPMPELIGFEA